VLVLCPKTRQDCPTGLQHDGQPFVDSLTVTPFLRYLSGRWAEMETKLVGANVGDTWFEWRKIYTLQSGDGWKFSRGGQPSRAFPENDDIFFLLLKSFVFLEIGS